MAVRAILFDLDGTLVDSERESVDAVAAVLDRDLGIAIDAADADYVVGHSWTAIYQHLQARHRRLAWSEAELIGRVVRERERMLAASGATIMPGARAAVDRFADLGRAVVTGSSRAEAEMLLAALGRRAAFDTVWASEDVGRSKPAPDGYLAAARALGVSAAECVVVEDSGPGIQAGRAAGARVVAVRAGNFSNHDQSAAHHVIDTLDELTRALVLDPDPDHPSG